MSRTRSGRTSESRVPRGPRGGARRRARRGWQPGALLATWSSAAWAEEPAPWRRRGRRAVRAATWTDGPSPPPTAPGAPSVWSWTRQRSPRTSPPVDPALPQARRGERARRRGGLRGKPPPPWTAASRPRGRSSSPRTRRRRARRPRLRTRTRSARWCPSARASPTSVAAQKLAGDPQPRGAAVRALGAAAPSLTAKDLPLVSTFLTKVLADEDEADSRRRDARRARDDRAARRAARAQLLGVYEGSLRRARRAAAARATD